MEKKDILNKIEFIRDECVSPDVFIHKCVNKGRRSISNFEDLLGTCINVLNLDAEGIDFYWHVYDLNWDNLNKETLTEDNIIIPKEVPYEIDVNVLVSRSGYERYFQNYDLYSEESYYYYYYLGTIHPLDGELIDEDIRESDEHGWDATFKKIESSVNESKISNNLKIEKLTKLKKIIENKINELKQI